MVSFKRVIAGGLVLIITVGLLVIDLHCRASVSAQEAAKPLEHATAGAEFVGSHVCMQCHSTEHGDWLTSHHAAAMQPATNATVLGRFDGTTFEKDGVTSTFFRRDGKFWVRTDGPEGKLADFEIRYTFGVTPLQQYLIALPGGRLQALGISWDARPATEGGQRWYHLHPDRKLSADDPLHWTGVDQNWNYQCAWCHSTNLRKNYDRTTRTFKTEWSEINVGCEACHGPASKHVAWASKPRAGEQSINTAKGFEFSLDERRGAAWAPSSSGKVVRSQKLASAREIQVCAQCHARRTQISDSAPAVQRYSDAFRTALLEPELYHADGQQRDEVYNLGSFLQSRMHAEGVTCSDCHNPHSGKLRQPGNSVCSQCHAPERYDAPEHHHHASGTRGAQCASCHMPTTTYMGVDARHDHSFRIPRPDRTHLLGTPNACNQCHVDKQPQWASDAIKRWYPEIQSGAQTFAEAFDLGDRGAPGAQAALMAVVDDDALAGIVRASAVSRLGRFASPMSIAAIVRSLEEKDPDIRLAAVAALSRIDVGIYGGRLVPLLRDESRLVRMEAARALAGAGERDLSPEVRSNFDKGLAEYVAAQLFNAERPESNVNLGALYQQRGRMVEARAAFDEALAIDRTFFPAALSLADLERLTGNEQRAEAILRASLEANPKSGALVHALGLSLVRQKRMTEAIEKLFEAVALSPEDPHFAYVLAVAMHGAGKPAEAVGVLKTALVRHPYDREILSALLSYEMESRDFGSALNRAELLTQLEPERSDIRHLAAQLRQQRR